MPISLDGNLGVYTSGNVSATGNITAAYYFGDGGYLSNIGSSGYGNSNVANYLPTNTTIININSNVANTDANVANLTLLVANNSSNITTLQGQVYSNANVAAYLPIYSGNISGGNIGITGAINAVGEITSFANIVASPGGYFQGDGSQLTNLPLGNYTGNISGANISITNTANLGNFTIYDQTLSGTITDRDVNVLVVGNADVNMGGGFNIHSSGNLSAVAEFQVSQDGQVTMLVPTPDQLAGAVRIVGSSTGVDVSPQNYGVMLHNTGQPSTPARIYNDGVSNYAAYVGRRYNGTSEAPTGVLNNQIISRIGATPYLTDDTWPAISTTRIDFVTTENQTTTAQGSKIQMWATPTGNTTPGLVADFGLGGINLTGNLIPTVDNIYSLGNITNRWIGAYFGNAGIYLQDTTLGVTGSMSLDNGQMLFDDNITSIQVGPVTGNAIQLTTDGLAVTNGVTDINIGTIGDTGNTHILNAGVKFTDGSVQNTAAIPLTQKGNALGVVPLNASTKIDPIYLPSGAITFKGVWNAANNTPTLVDGTGTNGDEYIVGVAGTQNLGSGNITFAVGDFILYTSSNVWVDIPAGSSGVQSFNGRDGVVTLQSGDVTNALSTGSIVNSKLANTGVTINTGTGLAGGGPVALGGTLTLTATGVVNVLGGTGVNVSTSGGNATVSIGQPVGIANSVQFFAVTANTTIQATGNVTGGNLTTAGRIVATGNIVTSGYYFGNGSQLTGLNAFQTINANGTNLTANSTAGLVNIIAGNNIVITSNVANANIVTAVSDSPSFTGNVTGGNIISLGNVRTTNLTVTSISNLNSNANVKISGGIAGQQLTTDGAGNLSWSFAQAGNTIVQSAGNTTVNVDFSTNSLHLLYLPTGPVTISLSNYTAGAQGRVIIRFNTPYTVNMGVANVQQTTEGLTTIPISGGGGHKINGNQSVQLLYTCYDNTAGNCYVASTFL